jgi:signal transduction histidine kinase
MLNRNKKEIELLNKLEKEILTPITYIQGYTSILKNSFDLPKKAIENLEKIERSAERIITTTQSLLLAYEIENLNNKNKLESVPALATTYDALKKFIRLAKTRKIDFSFSGQNTSNIATNKKFFVQALSILSQEILLSLEKGNIDVLVKKEGSDILVFFKIVFDQKNQTKISDTPGYSLAELFLKKSKNKISFKKNENSQTIIIRLNIVG